MRRHEECVVFPLEVCVRSVQGGAMSVSSWERRGAAKRKKVDGLSSRTFKAISDRL